MENYPVKAIYSPSEAAQICRIESALFLSMIRKNEIASFELPGRHVRVRHQDLSDFIKSRNLQVPAEWHGDPRKYRVLIVEDDPDLLEIISELLRDEPMVDVRAEDNGFTAGLQIAGWHPDLILLDFLMPGISGFDLCRKLRSRPETEDIPVLAVTSLTSKEDQATIFGCGVSDFLGKPFHSADLSRKVRTLLGIEIPAHHRHSAPRP